MLAEQFYVAIGEEWQISVRSTAKTYLNILLHLWMYAKRFFWLFFFFLSLPAFRFWVEFCFLFPLPEKLLLEKLEACAVHRCYLQIKYSISISWSRYEFWMNLPSSSLESSILTMRVCFDFSDVFLFIFLTFLLSCGVPGISSLTSS